MKTFTYVGRIVSALFLFATLFSSTLWANGPGFPSFLSSRSEAALGEMKLLFSDLGPDRENVFANLVILARNDESIPLEPNCKFFSPVAAVRELNIQDRRQIGKIIDQQIQENQRCDCDRELAFWQRMEVLFRKEERGVLIGKSWGEPNFITYDGYRYTSQQPGEFTLARSAVTGYEIQVRHTYLKKGIALNSAVAMNVRGDRVAVYSKKSEIPDGNYSTPLRINGQAIPLEGDQICMPKGGVVRFVEEDIHVYWPTGEILKITFMPAFNREYVNLVSVVHISPDAEYRGLLGNGNTFMHDDLLCRTGDLVWMPRGFYTLARVVNPKERIKKTLKLDEKKWRKHISTAYVISWRIHPRKSLFDYQPGKSANSFLVPNFEEKFIPLADLPRERVVEAKKLCEDAGVNELELRGCVTDVIFTNDNSFAAADALISNNDKILQDLQVEEPLAPTAQLVIPKPKEGTIPEALKGTVKKKKPLEKIPKSKPQTPPQSEEIPQPVKGGPKKPSTPTPGGPGSLFPKLIRKSFPPRESKPKLPPATPKPDSKPILTPN